MINFEASRVHEKKNQVKNKFTLFQVKFVPMWNNNILVS